MKRRPHRYILIPSDYRLAPIIGWLGPEGWRPDEPSDICDGVLIRVEETNDTPTMPPPSPHEH